jgi:hypothetical protein
MELKQSSINKSTPILYTFSFHVQLITQSIPTLTLTVEFVGKPRSFIKNVNGRFIVGDPIGHGTLNVLKTTEFVVEPTVYVITRLQLTVADLRGGTSTLSTAFP